MKKYMHIGFGLSLLLSAGMAPAYAVLSTNFWDDMESENHFDSPNANIGSWLGGEVRDTFLDGLTADAPGGSEKSLLVSRDISDSARGTPTEQAVLTATVHFEWDMYVADHGTNSTALIADSVLLRKDYGGGHPLALTFPWLRVERTNGVDAFVNERGINTNLAPVTVEAWHHYELDYTVGVANSLVLTIDGGTPIPIPEPFGFDQITGDVIEEVTGFMFRPPGTPDQVSESYVDNLLLVIDNPPLKEEATTPVSVADTRSCTIEDTLVGLRYGLQCTADVVSDPWETIPGWSAVGTGGTIHVFDPSPLTDTEKHYRIIVL